MKWCVLCQRMAKIETRAAVFWLEWEEAGQAKLVVDETKGGGHAVALPVEHCPMCGRAIRKDAEVAEG